MTDRLYYAEITALFPERIFSEKLALVSEERREKVLRYRFPEDRCRSLAAGLLLRRALLEQGIPESAQEIRLGYEGKPELVRYPEVFFNLSHSGKYCLCLLSGSPCGCDVEKIPEEDSRYLQIAERFFTPEERTYIALGREEEKKERFCRIWTLKESFLKATGTGFSRSLTGFSFRFPEGAGLSLVSEEGERGEWSFEEPELFPGYRIACCYADGKTHRAERISADPSEET